MSMTRWPLIRWKRRRLGIYTVTNTGSGSAPWVLTRDEGHQMSMRRWPLIRHLRWLWKRRRLARWNEGGNVVIYKAILNDIWSGKA